MGPRSEASVRIPVRLYSHAECPQGWLTGQADPVP